MAESAIHSERIRAELGLDLRRILLEQAEHVGGQAGERTLGILCAGTDFFRRRGGERSERALDVAGILPQRIHHEEVLETGRMVRDTLVRLVKTVLPRLES